MKEYKVLAINPGSTSTKVAVIQGEEVLFSKTVEHDAADFSAFGSVAEQLPYRRGKIDEVLAETKALDGGVDACVGRAGGLLPLKGGTYRISETILNHALHGANGSSHPAQLGIPLAHAYSKIYHCPAFTVNPPDVDEFQEVARVTGIRDVKRESHLHALNLKETAIRHSEKVGKCYEECNYIVCHIGGGISVSAHCKGKMIDGNDIIRGDGPMAPTRCGGLPAHDLIELCFSGKTKAEVMQYCTKTGGLLNLVGTADAKAVYERASAGESDCKLAWDAMIYQICKYIGSMAAVLHGDVDAILLGGGITYNEALTKEITSCCSFIAPVVVYPGEFEMEALAHGAIRVLKGEETAREYPYLNKVG